MHEKYLGNEENLEKFVQVGNLMWNTFCYSNFFQISMNFELIQRF
jgi:hypothetical protein